jgi:hypothetical protein
MRQAWCCGLDRVTGVCRVRVGLNSGWVCRVRGDNLAFNAWLGQGGPVRLHVEWRRGMVRARGRNELAREKWRK